MLRPSGCEESLPRAGYTGFLAVNRTANTFSPSEKMKLHPPRLTVSEYAEYATLSLPLPLAPLV